MKKNRVRKMHIILGIVILFITAIGIIAGRYIYGNLHPADEQYMKKITNAGFSEKSALLDDNSLINYGEGPDNGPALLLIHGQGMTWKDYADVLPELSTKFHVFAIDCYGHGESSHDDTLYSCVKNGNDLIWFMKNVIKEKCFVSGHSSGGVMTAWIAANAPEQVSGIVLEDPPLFRVTPTEMQEGASCFAWKDSFVIINNFLNQQEEPDYFTYYYKNSYLLSLFGGMKDKIAQEVELFRRENSGQIPRIFWAPYSLFRGMIYIDLYDVKFGKTFYDGSWMEGVDQETMLKSITCPVVYIKANTNFGKDGVLYAANNDEDAKKVQELISNCETITIKSGHNIHYEHPSVFVSACEKLLNK